MRGWGVCRRAISQLGSMWHCFFSVWDRSGAGEAAVVVVLDVIIVVDGGYVCIVSGDMAVLKEVLGCSTMVCVAVSVVLEVACLLKLM